jgi:hypothetical protein
MASRTVKFDTTDLSLIAEMGQMYLNEHDNSLGIAKQIQGIVRKCRNNAKTIKISSRKGKGRGLQMAVAEGISEMTGIPYDQSSDVCDIHSREMGLSGNDIILRGEALKKFPFSIECKCSESLNLTDTYEQVVANVVPGTDWLICHKRKSIPEIIVMLSWDAFKKIIKERK